MQSNWSTNRRYPKFSQQRSKQQGGGRFDELQLQNCNIKWMNEKRLVPAFRNEYEIQSYLDSEKKKHAVCQIMVSKERIHDTRIEEKPMTSTKKFLLQQVKNSTRVIIDPNPTPHSRSSNLPPPIQKYSLQRSLPSTARYSSSSISKICSTQAQNLTQKQPR